MTTEITIKKNRLRKERSKTYLFSGITFIVVGVVWLFTLPIDMFSYGFASAGVIEAAVGAIGLLAYRFIDKNVVQKKAMKLRKWVEWYILYGGPSAVSIFAVLALLWGGITGNWENPVYFVMLFFGGLLVIGWGGMLLWTFILQPAIRGIPNND